MMAKSEKEANEMKKSFSPEEERNLQKIFQESLPEGLKTKGKRIKGCSCSGCSCPPGSGDICDGGTYVGYAGGYYGASVG